MGLSVFAGYKHACKGQAMSLILKKKKNLVVRGTTAALSLIINYLNQNTTRSHSKLRLSQQDLSGAARTGG